MVTDELVFSPGDGFDVTQTFFGLGGLPSILWKAQEVDREVTVEAYTSKQDATLSWKAEAKQETEASVQARTNYEKTIASRKKGDTYPPPPPVVLETVTARGTVEFIDLQQAHTLSLPAYWLPGPNNLLRQRSAIWLSQDAYLELDRTGSTDVYFDVTSQAAGDLLKSSKDWAEAVRRLREQETQAQTRREPARLKKEGDKMDWPVTINGEQKMVRVIKAKNDFGELIILANEKNPLILKATINPLFPGISQAVGTNIEWNTLFGYEIKRLRLLSSKPLEP